jgi:hypothetical protein
MAQEDYLFTCKACGSHELSVIREFVRLDHYERILACTCEDATGQAAVKYYHRETVCRWDGILDEGHRVEWEEKEDVDELDHVDDGEEISCGRCVRNAAADAWERRLVESEQHPDSNEWTVCCAGCNREIEFGWSHPDRGGRIWPAECPDFNPWQCWPEPKYVETWAKKNWLRPRTR